MRNLLALSAAALVTFAGLGWYLGWYQVKTEPAGDGHRQVTIDIDGPKIGTDLKNGEKKLNDLVSRKGPGPASPGAAQGTPSELPPPPPQAGQGYRRPVLNPPEVVQDQPGWDRPPAGGGVNLPGPNDVQLPPPPSGPTANTGGDGFYVPPPLPAPPPVPVPGQ